MPLPLFDQHLHSKYSMDSRTEPEANVEAALARGLSGLTFTEHFDTHPDDWSACVYDDAAYSDAIRRLRDRYADRIFIGKGIEVCLQHDTLDFILDHLSRHQFDQITLSVHYFGDKAVHRRDNWTGIDAAEGTRRYLETALAAVRTAARLKQERGRRCFDVLGHLDLVKRYTCRIFNSYDVSPCANLIDDILRACRDADLVPEINTSSLRQGLQETMPGPATVLRYAQLGGNSLSLGSDSHRAEDIGAGFDIATAMLRAAGITCTARFVNRERIEVPLA